MIGDRTIWILNSVACSTYKCSSLERGANVRGSIDSRSVNWMALCKEYSSFEPNAVKVHGAATCSYLQWLCLDEAVKERGLQHFVAGRADKRPVRWRVCRVNKKLLLWNHTYREVMLPATPLLRTTSVAWEMEMELQKRLYLNSISPSSSHVHISVTFRLMHVAAACLKRQKVMKADIHISTGHDIVSWFGRPAQTL